MNQSTTRPENPGRQVTRGLLMALLLPALAAGCIVVDKRQTDELPTGVTLLESNQGVCDGPIEFEGEPGIVVDEGEDVTIQVADEDIEWRCLSGTPDRAEVSCPDETGYIRVTRDEDDSEFTVECFGA